MKKCACFDNLDDFQEHIIAELMAAERMAMEDRKDGTV